MASPLALMRRGVGHLEMTTHHRGFLSAAGEAAVGVLATGAVGFGVSYGLGQLYVRRGNKWYGKHAPKILAALGKIASVILAAAGHGYSAGVADAAGQAGVNALGLEWSMGHARKDLGIQVAALPASADLSKIPGARRVTSLGASRALTSDNLDELSAMH